MRVGISINTADLIGKWKDRRAAVVQEQRAIAPTIALVLQREAQAVMRKRIYSVKIPTGRSGKPLWRRTGDLIGRELWRAQGMDVVGTNDSDHAEARLLLGTPYGRPIRSPGVQQVDWQVEAVHNRRGWILKVRNEAQIRALRR